MRGIVMSGILSEAKENIVRLINAEIHRQFELTKRTFTLNAPNKFTTFFRGVWGSKTFIGENEFVVISAYLGKTGNIIIKFIDRRDWPRVAHSGIGGDIRAIEMREEVAREYLDGFDKFMAAAWDNREIEIIEETKQEVAKIEAEAAAMVPSPYDNPLFGSW